MRRILKSGVSILLVATLIITLLTGCDSKKESEHEINQWHNNEALIQDSPKYEEDILVGDKIEMEDYSDSKFISNQFYSMDSESYDFYNLPYGLNDENRNNN